MDSIVFAFFADINNGSPIIHLGFQFLCIDIVNLFDCFSLLDPGVYATFQIAKCIVKPHSRQAGDRFFFPPFWCDEQNGVFGIAN